MKIVNYLSSESIVTYVINFLRKEGFEEDERKDLGLSYSKEEITDLIDCRKFWFNTQVSFGHAEKTMNFNVFKKCKENDNYPFFYLQIKVFEKNYNKEVFRIIDISELVSYSRDIRIVLKEEIYNLQMKSRGGFF